MKNRCLPGVACPGASGSSLPGPGWFLLPVLLVCLILPVPGRGESEPWLLVDRIVATVDGEPVLETDIRLESDLGLLKVSGDEGWSSALQEAYLNRLLVLKEVEELGGFRLTEGQVEGAYEGYLERYADREAYEAKLLEWGIGEEEVFFRLGRALLATLYTESRIQFFVNILPSDIERAYYNDQERWGGTSLFDAWDTIKSELLQETYRQEKDRWLDTLKDRYNLIVLDPGGGP